MNYVLAVTGSLLASVAIKRFWKFILFGGRWHETPADDRGHAFPTRMHCSPSADQSFLHK
jgi:hypothetical protein